PSDYRVIASYNWDITSRPGDPRIIIPGSPRWLSLDSMRSRFTLQKDKGYATVDENHYRMKPGSPMAPLFRAVEVCEPDFEWGSVDIVTDRNNLRKLLRFCGTPGWRASSAEDPFQIFMSIRDNGPLVLTRSEVCDHAPPRGYGHNFEKKMTKATKRSPKNAGSYRTIVQWKIGNLNIIVRNEVDTCEKESAPAVSK
ncbi:unnamed protein product, partial [Discosporangium mesarthrocarpum]